MDLITECHLVHRCRLFQREFTSTHTMQTFPQSDHNLCGVLPKIVHIFTYNILKQGLQVCGFSHVCKKVVLSGWKLFIISNINKLTEKSHKRELHKVQKREITILAKTLLHCPANILYRI